MMTLQEAIKARHSVRAYKEQPLTNADAQALEEKIAEGKAPHPVNQERA